MKNINLKMRVKITHLVVIILNLPINVFNLLCLICFLKKKL